MSDKLAKTALDKLKGNIEKNKLTREDDFKRRMNLPKGDGDRPSAQEQKAKMPDVSMKPTGPLPGGAKPGWQTQFAASRGAGYLQAEETAQLPNPLVWNWPPRLRDDLYEFLWKHHVEKGHREEMAMLLSKLTAPEVTLLLDKMETFKADDLTSIGGAFYQGLLDEEERRRHGAPRIAVQTQVRVAEHQEHEEHEEHAALEGQKELKRLGR